MDRRTLKQAAREDVRRVNSEAKMVTLIYIALTLVLVVVELTVSLLLRNTGANSNSLSDTVAAGGRIFGIEYLTSLLCQFISVLLAAGYTAFSLRLIYRKPFSTGVLWEGFRRIGPVLLLYILMAVFLFLWTMLFFLVLGLVYTPFITYLGFGDLPDTTSPAVAAAYMEEFLSSPPFWAATLVLVIALTILIMIISYRYRMAYFLLMEYPQLTARQALKLSIAITKHHKFQLFVLDLSFIPWILLCSLTLGILLIWKLPYIQATYARAYRVMMDDYGKRRAERKADWDNMWLKEPAGDPEHSSEQTQEGE